LGITVNVKKLHPGAALPAYETAGSSGMDVCACLDAPVTVPAGKIVTIPSGLAFEIPCGYEIQVRPRSGLARKHGLTVFNSPGTIDSDYRGELAVILINSSDSEFTVRHGDRIAQLVLSPVTRAVLKEAARLSDTERGSGGFGSTGI
jgi:dUTP pyrophosphatase